MPLTYRIYRDAGLLFIRGEGVITQPERIRTMITWLEDPAYRTCFDALCDFSDTDSTPKLSELKELIAILEQHRPVMGPGKLAIVTSKPITFGVARVFEDLINLEAVPLQVRVFFDKELAWAWLRPEAPPLNPDT